MLFFRKKYFAGLDIGAGSVKIVRFREGKELVFDYFIRNIQYSDREDPTINQIQEVLDELIQESKNLGDSLVVGIQGISVFTRYIEIPRISTKELEVALPIEARKFIPFPLENVEITYSLLPTLSRDSKKMGVTFVGFPRNIRTKFDKFLSNFNVKSFVLESGAFALARAFKSSEHYRRGEIVIIVNIGTKYTNLAICKDGGVYFARDIAIGGRMLTRMLVDDETPEYSRAEVMKRTTNLFEDERSFRFIKPTLSRWIGELQDSIDYFTHQITDFPLYINRIILCGGGALLDGLPEYLNEKLNLPVDIDDEFSGKIEDNAKTEDLPRVGSFLKLAWGLALRAREESM